MAHGEVVELKNRELVMGGILEGDCEDRMADSRQTDTCLMATSPGQPGWAGII